MITVSCQQGTKEWHNARAGVITASMFKECCEKLKSGKNKGDFKKPAHDYAFRLAVERISGEALDEGGMDTFAMRRGRELEPDARFRHEQEIGTFVEEVGLALTDDGIFGASADGFIGEDEGAEYKCFINPEKIRDIVLTGDLSDVMHQIQGGLWITGRKVWHFALYCPALKNINKDFTLIKVERDDDFIAEMEAELLEFNVLVESYKKQLEDA